MDLNIYSFDFSLLPAHIITHILRYLKLEDFKNATSVCKSWHYASTDPKIIRSLVLQPTDDNFLELCNSNRRYGVLKLKHLTVEKLDNYYFELLEKFCPFVYELDINDSDFKVHHLLKLLELTMYLESFSLSICHLNSQLVGLAGLFPSIDNDENAKNRMVKKLSSVKTIEIHYYLYSFNIQFIADLIQCATNLNSLTFHIELFRADANFYKDLFNIFDSDSIGNLSHLNLFFNFPGHVNDFIINFVKIKKLNLRSFKIRISWDWERAVYNSSLFLQFILKLQSLWKFAVGGLEQDQLSIICRHLVNLKDLNCGLQGGNGALAELKNLKQLEKLRCGFPRYYRRCINLVEIDRFFTCKFEYLQSFTFVEVVTEPNLVQFCINHPNLIELQLECLLTRNLESIFKYLTKLRLLKIFFGYSRLRREIKNSINDVASFNLYEKYKISRLQDLEVLYLEELYGIQETDVGQLKKLRSSNLTKLFANCRMDKKSKFDNTD